MGRGDDGSADHPFSPDGGSGADVNSDPADGSPAGNPERDSIQVEGKGSVGRGGLLAAATKGTILTSYLGMFVLFPAIDPAAFPFRTGLWLCLAGFLGGMMSGSELEGGFRTHRWPLLYLAAGSPALPIWIVTMVALWVGVEIPKYILTAIVITCGTAVAGAIAGQYAAHYWRRAEKVPRLSFWKNWAKALACGSATTLLVSSCCALLVVILAFGAWETEWPNIVCIAGVLFLGPFLGGIVSGRMLCGILADVRWRPVYLASASPALPFVPLQLVFVMRFSSMQTGDELLGLLTFVVAAVLGSLAGYYATLHKKRLHQVRDFSNDSEEEPQAEDDG